MRLGSSTDGAAAQLYVGVDETEVLLKDQKRALDEHSGVLNDGTQIVFVTVVNKPTEALPSRVPLIGAVRPLERNRITSLGPDRERHWRTFGAECTDTTQVKYVSTGNGYEDLGIKFMPASRNANATDELKNLVIAQFASDVTLTRGTRSAGAEILLRSSAKIVVTILRKQDTRPSEPVENCGATPRKSRNRCWWWDFPLVVHDLFRQRLYVPQESHGELVIP